MLCLFQPCEVFMRGIAAKPDTHSHAKNMKKPKICKKKNKSTENNVDFACL